MAKSRTRSTETSQCEQFRLWRCKCPCHSQKLRASSAPGKWCQTFGRCLSVHSVCIFGPLTPIATRQSSAYANLIQDNPSLNLRDLAYTLHQRRSAFPYRISFAAKSANDLVTKIRGQLGATKVEDLGVRLSPPADGKRPKVLGIFTGQGAQYTRMGADLNEKSAAAQKIIQELQAHLDQLPEELRPDFLEKELRAAGESSRVLTGAFSFLSTVIQIVLVDLLRLGGVQLDAIVAHSSGEMAATYAAGRLTARDVMCVSYFRGRFSSKMESPNGPGIKGAMLAAGTSEEDAQALCVDEVFAGRVCVAAVNSFLSVTFSGDEEAIDEFKLILDDENRFNRKLRVDRAYHSNHVLRRLADYVGLIQAAGVRAVQPVPNTSLWISSVYAREVTSDMNISDEYWGTNVARAVKFYQALKAALEAGEYQVAIEVDPSLKGPSTQTIQEVLGKTIRYYGVLNRGTHAAVSIASSLGSLWCHLGERHLDLTRFDIVLNDDKSAIRVVKGVPSYQWKDEGSYWHESRAAKKLRAQTQPFNQLLETMMPDSAGHHLSWGHLLRTSEIDWVSGHKVQRQTVFPAAGYICTALEGARVLAGARDVRLFEPKDFIIHQALTFNQDDAGIKVQTSLSDIRRPSDDRIQAKFTLR